MRRKRRIRKGKNIRFLNKRKFEPGKGGGPINLLSKKDNGGIKVRQNNTRKSITLWEVFCMDEE